MKNNDSESYETLLAELNEVLLRIEKDETGIDELAEAIDLAYEKSSKLKRRLTEVEARLTEIISLREAGTDTESKMNPLKSGSGDHP